MRNNQIGVLILMLASVYLNAYSFPNDKTYNFVKGYKKFSFKIKSEKLSKLLKTKLMLKENDIVYADVNYSENKLSVKIVSKGDIDSKLKERLINVFTKKAKIFTGEDFKQWIKGYDIIESKSKNTRKYEDLTGLNDSDEIVLKEEGNKVTIDQKTTTGSIRTVLLYKNPPWALEGSVLSKVIREKIDGNESELSTSTFSYKKMANSKWIMSEVITETQQQINLKSTNDIKRKIREKFEFYDFSFN